MDNPRKLAFASLVRADALNSFSNLEINTVISRSELTKKDASLYTALYMGVTEKLLTLDYVISHYSSIKTDKLDIETKNALRLGLYQLMFMDRIPEYSAVSETVSICPKRSKGFVNAILRSFIREGKRVEYPEDRWERLSVISSTPPYIIDIFRASYGDEETVALLTHEYTHTGIYLRVNTLKTALSDLEAELKTLNGPIFLVGDGSNLCYNTLKGTVPALVLPPEHRLHQRAVGVALVAEKKLAAGESCDGAALTPNYLRLSQAERERMERENKK